MKLLLCIMMLVSISAYGINGENEQGESELWTGLAPLFTIAKVGNAPQILGHLKVPSVAPNPSPTVSDPTFQQRLDALAERVAAMETDIKS